MTIKSNKACEYRHRYCSSGRLPFTLYQHHQFLACQSFMSFPAALSLLSSYTCRVTRGDLQKSSSHHAPRRHYRHSDHQKFNFQFFASPTSSSFSRLIFVLLLSSAGNGRVMQRWAATTLEADRPAVQRSGDGITLRMMDSFMCRLGLARHGIFSFIASRHPHHYICE